MLSNSPMTNQMSANEEQEFAERMIASFFEKFSRFQLQECLSETTSNWILSPSEDMKALVAPLLGIVNTMQSYTEKYTAFMIPVEEGIDSICMREIHQIIRELVIGIYACNQLPSITLDANFDQSTACNIPAAYIDTHVGQLLINLDYMIKGLWHGSYFPRDRRMKFNEKWRTNMDVNTMGVAETKNPFLPEFTSAGLVDIAKDPDYADLSEKMNIDKNDKEFFSKSTSGTNHASLQMTVYQTNICQHHNLFVVESDWLLSSVVKLNEDPADRDTYERLNSILNQQEAAMKKHFEDKISVKKDLLMLRITAFFVPYLIAVKRRMSVPKLYDLLPVLPSDNTKTERELPPLIISPDYCVQNFYSPNSYFNLHGGIQFDLETPDAVPVSPEIYDAYNEIIETTQSFVETIHGLVQPLQQDSFPVNVMTIGGRSYYAFGIEFETYYSQYPQRPKWVQLMCEYMAKLRPKRLPIHDINIHEYFKQFFGTQQALKCKSLPIGLKASSERGLVAMFLTLCRKCPRTRLNKCDESGLSLLHHASQQNRMDIVSMLLNYKAEINAKIILYNSPPGVTGPCALHLAATSGALTAASCLLAHHASQIMYNQHGWAPIHCAAYYDHGPIIRLMLTRNPNILELPTKNSLKSTPLLLAASAGAITAIRYLMGFGALISRRDENGNSLIHLAALRFHTNVIDHFIRNPNPDIKVWLILVEMMNSSSVKKKSAAVRCLQKLTKDEPLHWKFIVASNSIPPLVALLNIDNDSIQCMTVSVLCNISENREVCNALTDCDAGPILISLLSSPVDDIQARSAVVLSDIGSVVPTEEEIAKKKAAPPPPPPVKKANDSDDVPTEEVKDIGTNKSDLVRDGAIQALVDVLDSDLEDVLVSSVNAIRVLCVGDISNQLKVAEAGGIESLIEFLSINSVKLQATTAACIAALCSNNPSNQYSFLAENVAEPLVQLLYAHNIKTQVNAAAALQAICENNSESQQTFIELKAHYALNKLLKVWSLEVREQGACSLWSLAGQKYVQQKFISSEIGIAGLTDLLLVSSETLHYVGCMGMTALGRTDIANQNQIVEYGGIKPLVRLLRSAKTSQLVLLHVIRVLGTLCVGVAHKNNFISQNAIAEEHAIPTLVNLMMDAQSSELKVEVAYAISCIVLSNHENQLRLKETTFGFDSLLNLLNNSTPTVQLSAGQALSMFAYSNTSQQYAIRQAGGLSYSVFEKLIANDDQLFKCHASFQMVILARVILDEHQVSITANGIANLINLMKSDDDNIIILTASRLSSLAHTRAGITDAMLSIGVIPLLVKNLHSSNDQVRVACAIALGYITYNRTGMRELLVICRNTVGLFDLLIENLKSKPVKISKEFTREYKCCKIIGLPVLSLERNGGPSINANKLSRPKTVCGYTRKDSTVIDRRRLKSAHFLESTVTHRAPTVGTFATKQVAPSNSEKADVPSVLQPTSGRESQKAFGRVISAPASVQRTQNDWMRCRSRQGAKSQQQKSATAKSAKRYYS